MNFFKSIKNIAFTIIKILSRVLFGLAFMFIQESADMVEEAVAEKKPEYAKRIKNCYIVLYILLFLGALVTIYVCNNNIWLLLVSSAVLLPFASWFLSLLDVIIYELLDHILSKFKKTFQLSSVIAFCLTAIIIFSAITGAYGYITYNTIAEEKEGTKQSAETTENYYSENTLNYERVEPEKYDTYILNTKTKKYHLPSCSYLPSKSNSKEIKQSKIGNYSDYTPCGHCDP